MRHMKRSRTLVICVAIFLLIAGVYGALHCSRKGDPWPTEKMARHIDDDFVQRAIAEVPLSPAEQALGNGTLSQIAARDQRTRQWVLDIVKNPDESWEDRKEALWVLGITDEVEAQRDYLLSLSAWIADTRARDRREALFRNVVRQRLVAFVLVSSLRDTECIEVFQRIYPQEWAETLQSLVETNPEMVSPDERAFQETMKKRASELLRSASRENRDSGQR